MNMKFLISILIFMPIAGAFFSYLLGRKSKHGRDTMVSVLTAAEFLCAVLLFFSYRSNGEAYLVLPEICGMGLSFTVDGFRAVYAVIASFMWMMTSILSTEYFAHYRNRNRYYLFLPFSHPALPIHTMP